MGRNERVSISLGSAAAAVAPLRPIHGVNLGPVERRWNLDYTPWFEQAHIPSIRTHDVSLFLGEAVDLHTVFPHPGADPEDLANYRFDLTDAYLRAIVDCGAEIYLRLGESIDHGPHKLYVSPDRWTPQRMATVCATIVARYADWTRADGQPALRHVEFWNEPDNRWDRPASERTCWGGDAEEFARYYIAVSTVIRDISPRIRIGLAGFVKPWFIHPPSSPDFVPGWSTIVQELVGKAPIDFVSWHCYTGSWTKLHDLVVRVRESLDDMGLSQAESHLTEWRPLASVTDEGGSFSFGRALRTMRPDRVQATLDGMHGPLAAGFTFGALADLSDQGLDLAHFYTGIGPYWGLFDLYTRPTPVYHAFAWYGELTATDEWTRIAASSDDDVVRVVGSQRHSETVLTIASIEPREHLTIECGEHHVVHIEEVTADGWHPSTLTVTSQGSTLVLAGVEPGLLRVHLQH